MSTCPKSTSCSKKLSFLAISASSSSSVISPAAGGGLPPDALEEAPAPPPRFLLGASVATALDRVTGRRELAASTESGASASPSSSSTTVEEAVRREWRGVALDLPLGLGLDLRPRCTQARGTISCSLSPLDGPW